MYNNKNYDRDINYTYELNRFMLRLLGVWPDANKKFSIIQKLKKSVLILGYYFLLCLELTSMLLYIFMVVKGTRARLKLMTSLLFTIVTILKYSNLFYVKGQMKNCITRVEKDFQSVVSPTARNTMLFHAKTSRRLFIMCGIFMYSGGMAYRTLLPLARGKIVTAENITIRQLPCPGHYIIFDAQISPAYEIVFFVQCMIGVFKYAITVAACGIATLFAMHVVAQLDILVALMSSLTNEYKLENVNKKLSIIVEHQIKTRDLLRMVQGVTHFSSFVELMTCTSMICFMIYCLIVEWEDNNALATCTYLLCATPLVFNIFIYCFIGEQLSEKGEQVALTACTLDWHLLPDAEARELILIMLMSNTPMKLKAGNFVELSFRTFGSVSNTSKRTILYSYKVVKTAMGYLNLVRSVVE